MTGNTGLSHSGSRTKIKIFVLIPSLFLFPNMCKWEHISGMGDLKQFYIIDKCIGECLWRGVEEDYPWDEGSPNAGGAVTTASTRSRSHTLAALPSFSSEVD